MHPFIIASIGGVVIGLSATLVEKWFSRVAGISGILGSLSTATNTDSDRRFQIPFLLGLIGTGFAAGFWMPATLPQPSELRTLVWLIPAGLLVGFGTQLGGGCTSGHGVCGLARGSKRSLVAVLVFMFTAAVTVFVLRTGGF